MNLKCIIDEHHYSSVRRWANGSQQWIPYKISPNVSLVVFLTPPPYSFIVGCGVYNSDYEAVRPLLLLKDPVASYYLSFPLKQGELKLLEWKALCEAILVHNPGLNGALQRITIDYFTHEKENLP